MDSHRYCRVCGYEPADPPWSADGRMSTFDICMVGSAPVGGRPIDRTATCPGVAADVAGGWLRRRR